MIRCPRTGASRAYPGSRSSLGVDVKDGPSRRRPRRRAASSTTWDSSALQHPAEALPGRDHADAAHDAGGGEDRRLERAGPAVYFVVAHSKTFVRDHGQSALKLVRISQRRCPCAPAVLCPRSTAARLWAGARGLRARSRPRARWCRTSVQGGASIMTEKGARSLGRGELEPLAELIEQLDDLCEGFSGHTPRVSV